jgi:hypothetical protein
MAPPMPCTTAVDLAIDIERLIITPQSSTDMA